MSLYQYKADQAALENAGLFALNLKTKQHSYHLGHFSVDFMNQNLTNCYSYGSNFIL